MRYKIIFTIIIAFCLAVYLGFVYKKFNPVINKIDPVVVSEGVLSYSSLEVGIAFNIPNDYAMSDWRDISGRADQVNIFAEIYKINPDGTAIDAPPVLAFERVRGLSFPDDADLSNLGVVTEIKPIDLNCGQGKILTVETEDYGGEKIIYHVYLFHDGQNLFRLSGWEGVDWPGATEFVNSIKLLNCVK